MENKQYLIFRLQDMQLGIEATLVEEIFPLPELITITTAPADVIGILNLRGQILPVVHLELVLGRTLSGCQKSDRVIAVRCSDLQMGMVVNQVNELLELGAEEIDTKPHLEFLSNIDTALISGIAKVDTQTIVLLNSKALVHHYDRLLALIWNAQFQLEIAHEEASVDTTSFYDRYCPNASPQERAIFQQRAADIKQFISPVKETQRKIPLAVVGFGNKYFGLEIELVREFTYIDNLAPIPCCPLHIAGNMNLRGEIITLVDIRNILRLPSTPVNVGDKAVVVQANDIVAGLPVDSVFDVIYVNEAELSCCDSKYLRFSTYFEGKELSVLNLLAILTHPAMVVNEEV